MKRILLTLLCLFIVSIGACSAFAYSAGDVEADDDSIPTSDNSHFFVSAGNGTYDFNMTQHIYPDDADDDSIPTSDNSHFFVSAGNGTYDFNMTQHIYPDDADESGASQTTQDNSAIDYPSPLDDSIVTVQT